MSRAKAKIFIFNTPHNPTGKVFTREETLQISDILDDFPHILTISDEVYNFLTFDGKVHTPFATVGNNWDRTISVYSGGKLLSCTGWKVGWSIGPAHLLHVGRIVAHTVFNSFNPCAQIAIANSVDQAYDQSTKANFIEKQIKFFKGNRDYLNKALNDMKLPWKPLKCEGGYFLMADISECKSLIPAKYQASHSYEEKQTVGAYELNMPNGKVPLDLAFCRWMACEKGCTMMPNSFFYESTSPYICDKYVRLAICKNPISTKTVGEKLKKTKW